MTAVAPRPQQIGGGGPIWTLGLGAFGLAFALTTTAAYLPPLLERFTGSTTLIALVLAAEGVFALLLPVVIGSWSDTFHTPLGRRRPFMLVALGPMAFCLALVAFMPSFWTTAAVVFAFFFAYYVYEPPYRASTPTSSPRSGTVARRASSTSCAASRSGRRSSAAACSSTFGGRGRSSWRPW